MASKAPFGTDLQAKFDVQLVGGKIIHKPIATSLRSKDSSISGAIKAHKKLRETQGAVSMSREREGMFRPRSKRAKSIEILPVVEEGATESVDENIRQRIPCAQPVAKDIKLPTIVVHSSAESSNSAALNEEQENEACQLIESIFKPLLNKLGAIEEISRSCRHADSTGLGVLNFDALLDIYNSHGAKLSKNTLKKLCELSPCTVGEQHVLYEKLCSHVMQVLSNTYPNKDATDIHPVTPYGSTIGCDSPDSVEDLQISYSLPILKDRTNSLPFQRPKPKYNRGLATHPLSKSATMKNTLPPISSTAPSGEKSREKQVLEKLPTRSNDTADGIEKMVNALRSCTDSQGLLEIEHAQRVLQNYNLIYKLNLPSQDIQEYVNRNSTTKPCDLRLFIDVESLLKHLTNSYFQ